MAKLAVCPICGKPTTVRGFNWFLFLILGVITGGTFMIFYLIYYFVRSKKCQWCGVKF